MTDSPRKTLSFPLARCLLMAAAVCWLPFPLWDSASSAAEESAPAASNATGTDGQDELEKLREKRAAIQGQLQTALRADRRADDAPAGTSQEERAERRTLLQQILRAYDEQIDDRQRLDQVRSRTVQPVTQDRADLPPPPYSVLYADDVWNSAYSQRLAVEGLASQLTLIALRVDRGREALQAAEEALRQAVERWEAARGSDHADRERWLLDLQRLRHQAAGALLGAAELSKQRIEAESADARAQLQAAEHRVALIEPHTVFTQEDHVKILSSLTKERQRLVDELDATATARRTAIQELRALEERLAARRDKGRGTRTVQRLRAEVDVQRIGADNLSLTSDLVQLLLDVVEGERQLWNSRFTIATSPEPGIARQAYERFAPLFDNFSASRDYLRQQAGIVGGQIGEWETRLKNGRSGDRLQAQAMLQAYRQREQIYDRTLRRVEDAARFLDRWTSIVKEQRRELPLTVRLTDWAQRASERLQALWHWELFSAEDTIEVDGKTITGRRSVTVGKVLSVVAILTVGYRLCLLFAGYLGRLAVRRLGLTPELGSLIRQWSQALLVIVLIVVSFMWVKIPLTIFAFLGGAVAIGVGFGAQNLLKNVISGILLLIERPLRVGDMVEVDNVRGRVTTIGLRSSTVRDAKGMVTLIPNSSFLERHLTNWTYSSRVARFSLRIGAPYNAPTRQVMDLMAGLAREHPAVLKAPEPRVLLDEFGAQARIFTLNYWLDVRQDLDPSEVASELRYSIETKFGEAGFKILPAA